VAVFFREQYWLPFVVAYPGGVVPATIAEMWSGENMDAAVFEPADQRNKTHSLQDDRYEGMREDRLFNPVTAVTAGIRDAIERHTVMYIFDHVARIVSLFRIKPVAAGDDESHVGHGGLIGTGKKHLGDNAMMKREPDIRLLAEPCPYALLGARRPVRRSAGETGRHGQFRAVPSPGPGGRQYREQGSRPKQPDAVRWREALNSRRYGFNASHKR
jgi:hypothetical protein